MTVFLQPCVCPDVDHRGKRNPSHVRRRPIRLLGATYLKFSTIPMMATAIPNPNGTVSRIWGTMS